MLINGIDTKDISVVVQGAISKQYTPNALNSIRKILPGAEIILSTWEGSDVSGLDYDILLLNQDPGGFKMFSFANSPISSIDRQIYSTWEGLKQSKRKYAAKLRSDYYFESADFLAWINRFPAKNKEYSFFKGKIICCDLFSRNPRCREGGARHALHPADFFFFGLTCDLLDLFSTPKTSVEDATYLANLTVPLKIKGYEILPAHRYAPEQHIWISWLKRRIPGYDAFPEHMFSITPESIRMTERTFSSNLIILSNEQIGLRNGKPRVTGANDGNCFTHGEWKLLYRYYCEGSLSAWLFYRLKIATKNMIRFFQYNGKDFIKFLWYRLSPVGRNFSKLKQELNQLDSLNLNIMGSVQLLQENRKVLTKLLKMQNETSLEVQTGPIKGERK